MTLAAVGLRFVFGFLLWQLCGSLVGPLGLHFDKFLDPIGLRGPTRCYKHGMFSSARKTLETQCFFGIAKKHYETSTFEPFGVRFGPKLSFDSSKYVIKLVFFGVDDRETAINVTYFVHLLQKSEPPAENDASRSGGRAIVFLRSLW